MFLPRLQRLKIVMEQRAKAFVNYRHFIAIRAKFFFQMMLSQRGYSGKMVFDHGNETLGLQVRLLLGFLIFFACTLLKIVVSNVTHGDFTLHVALRKRK